MNGQEEQKNSVDDNDLTNTAVELVVSLMKSADTEIIKPRDWWKRAKTALIVSSSVAETYNSMISKYLEKIQVAAPRIDTSEKIAEVGEYISSIGLSGWERFRFLCERDALYIIAMAQVLNQQLKG